jgi:hypothetical protein
MELLPAFDFARKPHTTSINSKGDKVTFQTDDLTIEVHASNLKFSSEHISRGGKDLKGDGIVIDFVLNEGEYVVLVLNSTLPKFVPLSPDDSNEIYENSMAYWRSWMASCNYRGKWETNVRRYDSIFH